MLEELSERESRVRAAWGLAGDVKLLREDAVPPVLENATAEHLARFNIEWHIIPSAAAVPFDENYVERFYGMCGRDFQRGGLCQELAAGHSRHQGRIVGVEATAKPRYLPGNRQHYGTPYGFDATADPFAPYMARAGFTTGTRFAHNYASLRGLGELINNDWRTRGLLPPGYRLSVCPPVIFNLIGNLFHTEWSATDALELSAYRDDKGNATCYAVGSNAPGDFSYVQRIATDSDWTLLGFRLALVPE